MEITSVNNDLVKDAKKLQQKKYRDEEGCFLLEGSKAVEEWYNKGFKFKQIFVLKDKIEKYKFIKNEELILTNSAVLKKISTTATEPEIIGIAPKIEFNRTVLNSAKKVVLLEGIKDSGNFGTILRAATAFNIDAIILYGNCIDIYNPKCIRAAVGNFGKIPVFEMASVSELDKYFSNFKRIATLPLSSNLLKNYETKLPFLLMFGSEADGLSDELINYSTDNVKIEMSKDVESLNLSVSCAILMYELMN